MSGLEDFKKAVHIQDSVKDFAEDLEQTYQVKVITCEEEGYVPGSLKPFDFIQVRILLSDEQDRAMTAYVKEHSSLMFDLMSCFPSTSNCATEYDCGAAYYSWNELYFDTARDGIPNLLDTWNLPRVMATGDEYVTREERKAMVEEVGKIVQERVYRSDAAVHRWVDELSQKAGVDFKVAGHERGDATTTITLKVEAPEEELETLRDNE